jgi:tetratricopeptide (TPR) repeat protein
LLLYRETQDEHDIAMALEEVGEPLAQLGEVALARERFSEALHLLREHGTEVETGRVLISMGYLELTQLNHERAAELFQEAADRMRRSSRAGEVAYALLNLGTARLALDHLEAADADLRESFGLYRSLKSPVGYAYSVEALGILRARLSEYEGAVLLLGAADRMFQENGVAMQSFERTLHEATVGTLETALGRTAFAIAWNRGAALTDDEIVSAVERA